MKNCTPLWREAHFEVKMLSRHHRFGPLLEVEMSKKCTPFVARSTFPSQNVQNTLFSDHCWKLRCRKSRCGAKHISNSKCTVQNTPGSDHFWKLRCRKSAHRCGAKHISKVKMYKAHHVRTTFGHARFAWQAQGIVHLVKSEQNVRVLWHFQLQPPLNHTTLQYTTPQLQLQLHLHYIPVHCTPLHPLQSPTLHSITLNYATLHNTTLHSITLNYATLHNTTLHSTTLHYITLHYLPLHFTTLHYTTLNYTTTTTATTLHYTPLH